MGINDALQQWTERDDSGGSDHQTWRAEPGDSITGTIVGARNHTFPADENKPENKVIILAIECDERPTEDGEVIGDPNDDAWTFEQVIGSWKAKRMVQRAIAAGLNFDGAAWHCERLKGEKNKHGGRTSNWEMTLDGVDLSDDDAVNAAADGGSKSKKGDKKAKGKKGKKGKSKKRSMT